jgi:hypothetical protein
MPQITADTKPLFCTEERRVWGFHSRYMNLVRTSQETHYVSTTESNLLMLCKIWDFHGSDYEECRLLGYKIPVRTSQETHYVSATEPSRLMLCNIEVFTAVTMKNAVFWDVTPCDSNSFWLLLTPFLARWLLSPWRWRRYVPPKRWFSQEPHGVTFLIV